MPSVYIETTVISYLGARISSDLVTAAHQQITFDWWHTRRHAFSLYVSELVHQEAAAGDREQAARRHDLMEGLVSLALTASVRQFATSLVNRQVVPAQATADAAHIAIAAVHGIDYLMTWNLRHIANAQMRFRIERACLEAGYAHPVICTPEELLETP